MGVLPPVPTECIEAIYDAAAGARRWIEVGPHLQSLLEAPTVKLNLRSHGELLHEEDPSDRLYDEYFYSVDPIRAQAIRDFTHARSAHMLNAKIGPELVEESLMLRGEFYNDFARQLGRRHVMGGMLGIEQATPIIVYRPDGAQAFTYDDCNKLKAVLPHIQRALELREKLIRHEQSSRLAMSMLDAMPISMILVDAGGRVRFANAAGVRALARPGSGLSMLRSGPRLSSGVYLTARNRDDAITLKRLIASAGRGGAGGSIRVRPSDNDFAHEVPMQAALVSPAPSGMLVDADPVLREAGGLALVVIEDLAQRAFPSANMLSDLFGLSRSEAEVALGLIGGASAEDVASGRNVALDTVRNQIRAILRKSEASNLRDLERIMAILAIATPADETAQSWRADHL